MIKSGEVITEATLRAVFNIDLATWKPLSKELKPFLLSATQKTYKTKESVSWLLDKYSAEKAERTEEDINVKAQEMRLEAEKAVAARREYDKYAEAYSNRKEATDAIDYYRMACVYGVSEVSKRLSERLVGEDMVGLYAKSMPIINEVLTDLWKGNIEKNE
jgi:hypothetical protein